MTWKNSNWTFKSKKLFILLIMLLRIHNLLSSESYFSCRITKADHPNYLFFNEAPVAYAPCQKHLQMDLDDKLNFNILDKKKVAKSKKGIWIIC